MQQWSLHFLSFVCGLIINWNCALVNLRSCKMFGCQLSMAPLRTLADAQVLHSIGPRKGFWCTTNLQKKTYFQSSATFGRSDLFTLYMVLENVKFSSLLSFLNVCSWCDIEQCLVTNFQWVWRWHRRHWTKASQGSHTHTAEQFSLWDAFSNGLQRHLPSFGSASAYKVLLHVLAAIRRMGKSIGPKVYHQGSLLLLYTVSHQSPKDKNPDAETIDRI